MTALHLAAKNGNFEACTLILTEQNSTSTRSLLDAQDDGGWTALVWACEHGHFGIVKWVAPFSTHFLGNLMVASNFRYLVTKKADPLIRDTEQNIALHWSTFSGSGDICELLLNSGCNVNAANSQGDTPLYALFPLPLCLFLFTFGPFAATLELVRITTKSSSCFWPEEPKWILRIWMGTGPWTAAPMKDLIAGQPSTWMYNCRHYLPILKKGPRGFCPSMSQYKKLWLNY